MRVFRRHIGQVLQQAVRTASCQTGPVFLAIMIVLATTIQAYANTGKSNHIDDLAEANHELTCTPTLDHFCANIHIGCAGRSALKTWAFKITTDGKQGAMSSAKAQPTEPIREGEIKRDATHNSLILFLHPSKDYVRVLPTGKFSFRHYTKRGPLMTYGWCKVDISRHVHLQNKAVKQPTTQPLSINKSDSTGTNTSAAAISESAVSVSTP